jgi:long-chain fatty acid transport protein
MVRLLLPAAASSLFFAPLPSLAAGLFVDGTSARSQALAGAGVTGLDSNLEALGSNPAALSPTRRFSLEVGGEAGWIDGNFSNRVNNDVHMQTSGVVPHGAIGASWGPLAFGLGVIPDAAMSANWRYRDAAGGLGGAASYGTRQYFSEIALIRTAFGVSYSITPQLSIGAGLGLLYNKNRLEAPYTIQTQTQLAGAKTLLDLDTDGWGFNGQFGVLWKPRNDLSFAVSYSLPSRLKTKGHATANSGRQLSALGLNNVDATTDFDAEVTNEFPQTISLGATWQATPRLQVVAQVDWIDWSSSFDTLEVRLKNTNNELYRALLAGGKDLNDDVPLDWKDQWVPRIGAEYKITDNFAVRAGYRYSRSPVPSETLTPLTAAISEHLISAGLGYRTGRFTADVAYQWHIPNTQHIGESRLLSGEYSDSDIEVSIHTVGMTLGVEF